MNGPVAPGKRSSVFLANLLGHRKSDASAMSIRCRSSEWTEYPIRIGRAEPGTSVGDPDRSGRPELQFDLAVLRRVARRVDEEIGKHLLEPIRVGANPCELSRRAVHEHLSSLLELRDCDLSGIVENPAQFTCDRMHLERRASQPRSSPRSLRSEDKCATCRLDNGRCVRAAAARGAQFGCRRNGAQRLRSSCATNDTNRFRSSRDDRHDGRRVAARCRIARITPHVPNPCPRNTRQSLP